MWYSNIPYFYWSYSTSSVPRYKVFLTFSIYLHTSSGSVKFSSMSSSPLMMVQVISSPVQNNNNVADQIYNRNNVVEISQLILQCSWDKTTMKKVPEAVSNSKFPLENKSWLTYGLHYFVWMLNVLLRSIVWVFLSVCFKKVVVP